MSADFLYSGRRVCYDHMDVKKQRYSGRRVCCDHMDVKEQRCSGLRV
ncbi:MAG: hypothetical protein ACI9N3_002219 [Colwellia sp.]|jgi:hypothetical protein